MRSRSIRPVAALAFLLLGAIHLTADNPSKEAASLESKTHWAFQALNRPLPPTASVDGFGYNEIDQFIADKLQKYNLRFAPEANRRTLIRRLSFDLKGLPPTLNDIQSYLSDTSEQAYEHLVDSLLNSPAYGERWAQHWLDVARFAESDGFEHDKVRQNSWQYRDWVINALNQDLPIDKFIQLQIAGDELLPGDPSAAVATGFLFSGPDMPDINSNDERRHTVLNEITSTIGSSILGLTMGCAQCHDHKFDPISQVEFYQLRAFLENINFPDRNKQLPHHVSESDDTPPISHLMVRGDFKRKGRQVEPSFVKAIDHNLAALKKTKSTGTGSTSGLRTRLAQWLTHPKHPMTTRVFVNRVWMHHFGRPLVNTPNDFGTRGQPPTHPELLDWLATELPRRNWSLKNLHKLIVMSKTYRQSSLGEGSSWKQRVDSDPSNEFYSRMNRNRLDGETIRDSMLSIGNALNRIQHGPSFRPPLPTEVTVTLLKNQWPVTENLEEHHRRSIYLFARRNLRYPMFEVFDRPDALASCAQRHESTTAPQSLTLLNSEFSLARAKDMAGVIHEQFPSNPELQIRSCFEKTLTRLPSEEEFNQSFAFLKEQATALKNQGRVTANLALPPLTTDTPNETYQSAALVELCLALFNLNEFIYVD